MTADRLYLTGRADADALLAGDPNALLLGMVLDQRVRYLWRMAEPTDDGEGRRFAGDAILGA